MKKPGTLLLIGILTFVIIFFIKRPEVLEAIWLWMIGLAGGIGALVKRLLTLDDKTDNIETEDHLHKPELVELDEDDFDGVTLTVLRYVDDDSTTLGLLYINGQYYCYSLEDSFQVTKVPGETRIPSGEYMIDFKRMDTPLTKTYRSRFDWFTYHLEIQNVENFENVYIHSGGDHEDTKGCLLVSDSLNSSEAATFFTNSRNTFKNLYQYVESQLNEGVSVRLIIRDEDWVLRLTA